MLDRPATSNTGIQVIKPEPFPVAGLLCGKPVEEAAEILPRLFNLCRKAQSVAIRMALGLPVEKDHGVGEEIRDEHVLRLAIMLPGRLGIDLVPFPRNNSDALVDALFGDADVLDHPLAFNAFLESRHGIAPVLSEIRARFHPYDASPPPMLLVNACSILSLSPLENSVAARHEDHPVLRFIEASYGRGPFWRVSARAIDLHAILLGHVPEPRLVAPGFAVVPVARGLSAIRAVTERGRVKHLKRMVPTDHLLATGGLLEQSLAALPEARRHLAGLLMDILDPCVPVRLGGTQDA
ncbi:MAG: hydrogenase expression/formation protein HupK [Pseudomonadota bacterium]